MNFIKPKSVYKKTKRYAKAHPTGIYRTISMSLLSALLTFGVWFSQRVITLHDQDKKKADTIRVKDDSWKAKRDSMQKVLIAKMDTSIENQKKIMVKLRIK